MQLGPFCRDKESQRQRSRKVKRKCFCRVESRWGRGLFVLQHASLSVQCCAVSRRCRGSRRVTTPPAIHILQFHTVTTCRVPFCPTAAQTLGVPAIWTLERDPRELQRHDSSFFSPPAGASQRPGGTADSKRLRSHSGNTETGEEDSR